MKIPADIQALPARLRGVQEHTFISQDGTLRSWQRRCLRCQVVGRGKTAVSGRTDSSCTSHHGSSTLTSTGSTGGTACCGCTSSSGSPAAGSGTGAAGRPRTTNSAATSRLCTAGRGATFEGVASTPPPPPPLPWSTASNATFTPTAWGNKAIPHQIVFSSPQQVGAAAAGYWSGMASGRYGPWSGAPWSGAAGALWSANLKQIEIHRAKAAMNSLCIDVSAFLTAEDQKLNQQKQKLAAASC